MRGLRLLLKNLAKNETLPNFVDICLNASHDWVSGYCYEPIGGIFTDGAEFSLWQVPIKLVNSRKTELENWIHGQNDDISIKALTISTRLAHTFAWMTFKSNCFDLDGRLVDRMNRVLQSIRQFGKHSWGLADEELREIRVTKLDATVDLKGAFLPLDTTLAQQLIQIKLGTIAGDLVNDRKFYFHTMDHQIVPTVLFGDNNLETCLQYDFFDDNKERFLKVKVYDKVTDLFCHESMKTVGSRVREVVGCKRDMDVIQNKLRSAQFLGMARLEISVYFGSAPEL